MNNSIHQTKIAEARTLSIPQLMSILTKTDRDSFIGTKLSVTEQRNALELIFVSKTLKGV
jgi:hypothetical protein